MKKTKKFNQITEKAELLFRKHGFNRVTVEEICKKADVSKMTYYKYFKNKDELIKYIWKCWVDEGLDELDKLRTMEIPFTDKINRILKMKEEAAEKYGKDLIHDYFNAKPQMQKYFNEIYSQSLGHFIKFIKEAQRNGEVRKDIKPEFFIAVLNKIMELAKDDNLISLYPTYKDFVLEVNKYIYFGLMPIEGRNEN